MLLFYTHLIKNFVRIPFIKILPCRWALRHRYSCHCCSCRACRQIHFFFIFSYLSFQHIWICFCALCSVRLLLFQLPSAELWSTARQFRCESVVAQNIIVGILRRREHNNNNVNEVFLVPFGARCRRQALQCGSNRNRETEKIYWISITSYFFVKLPNAIAACDESNGEHFFHWILWGISMRIVDYGLRCVLAVCFTVKEWR